VPGDLGNPADLRSIVERTLAGTFPIRRLGDPAEIADLICFLASEGFPLARSVAPSLLKQNRPANAYL
jgi:NAD(P)-dependent dehydrogenase (short-subunit alcohol dehydrogenase family)